MNSNRTRKSRTADVVEDITANFDLENLRPFLERIVSLVNSGFGKREVARVLKLAENMEVDDERQIRFNTVVDDRKSQLVIRVFMDDIDLPDVSFLARGELARRITAELRGFRTVTEVSAADVEATLEMAETSVEPVLTIGQFKRRLSRWRSRDANLRLAPLRNLTDVPPDPKRAVGLMRDGDMDDPGFHDMILLDTRRMEFILWNMRRSPAFLNRLSLAGVPWITLDRPAFEWVRTQLSGRKVAAKGVIG